MGPYGILPVMIIKTKNRKSLPLEEFGMSVQDINMTPIDMTIKMGSSLRPLLTVQKQPPEIFF